MLCHFWPFADVPSVATLDTETMFSIREVGYDVPQVDARIVALEARIEDLEKAAASAPGGDVLSEARFEALRLLMTAREDAQDMVDEARREAAAIVASAQANPIAEPPMPKLEPHLEFIKSELPNGQQRAFVAVAKRRVG